MQKKFIEKIHIDEIDQHNYLFEIEGLKKFKSLSFKKPITFFTGENGTGKSTLLEAIAVNWGFNAEGGSKNFNFSTNNNTYSELYKYLRISRGASQATDGFFLRAESFFNLATYTEKIGLDFSEYGDKPIHQQSHGESFMNLVNHRFRGNGLYLLDEPESALSIQRQLSLMASINDLVENASQFIIVTHSPVILAMPNAQIISFDSDTPLEVSYENTKPYELINLFLSNRDSLLSKLFKNI